MPTEGLRFSATLFAAVLFASPGASSPEAAPAAPVCAPQISTRLFMQSSLDGWDLVSRKILRLPPAELPWMVMFDRACAYHLAPDRKTELGNSLNQVTSGLTFGDREVELASSPLATSPLGDAVLLPNRARISVNGSAFTSLYERDGALLPFFAVALPEVWETDPAYRDDPEDDWRGFVLDVLTHEMVHTRQLGSIVGRVEALYARIPGLPSALDDDLVQHRFAEVPGFDATVRAEIALLYEAAAATDDGHARELARRSIDLTKARRATYYGNEREAWSAMEDVFLNMEGVACWSAYRRLLATTEHATPAELLNDIRDNRKWWSQEHGLALYLVLDRFSRDWIAPTFPPELASPLDLLDRALAAGGA